MDLLKTEIARAKPTVILAAVGDYAEHSILRAVFGSEGWVFDTEKEDQNATKLYDPIGVPILWTNHPQNMIGAGNLEKSRAFCVAAIVDVLRKGRV
jgi:hypothetical protein